MCSLLFHLLHPPGLICVRSWYLSAHFAVTVQVINITSGSREFLHLLIPQTGVATDFILFTHQFSCPFLFFFGCFFSSSGTPEQPMEASYEEVVIKVIQQEWTCLDFQQLPCWTVMEDMPRM